MSSLAFGLALAGLASLALNGSYLLQHAGSVHAPAIDARRPLATVCSLLRSRLWAVGAAVGIGGWALHVAALSRAPLSLVQAFVAGTLALIAPIAARMLHQRLQPVEWLAVGIVACALVMLAIGIHNPGARSHARPGPLAAFVAMSVAAAAALAFGARSWRAHALGLAGGILYGAADTAIKALTGTGHGIAGVVASPWFAAAAITTICAFFAFQRGLQTGRAIPVVVLMTGGTTVVSVCGGLAVFGDPVGRTPLLVALHVAGFALVAVGSAVLAPAAHPPEVPAAGDDAARLVASPA